MITTDLSPREAFACQQFASILKELSDFELRKQYELTIKAYQNARAESRKQQDLTMALYEDVRIIANEFNKRGMLK